MSTRYDAVVVGAGPNGLVAAIELARNDLSVLVVEGRDTIGGGTRTEELTLPGYLHDVCSTAHPLGRASPVLSELPLDRHGLAWVTPPAAVAHPLDDGPAALVAGSVEETAAGLGEDGDRYRRRMDPLMRTVDATLAAALSPVLGIPSDPMAWLRLGLHGMPPATVYARGFETTRARALLAGLAAHSVVPLSRPATSAVGITLALAAHRNGWPFVRGGSANLAAALAAHLESLGGEVRTGQWVRSLDELPPSRATMLDVTPLQLAGLAGDRLPWRARRRSRRWRHGPAVFKADYALSSPVPWRDPRVSEAGTVHLGGTFEEIADAERRTWSGEAVERPFVLLAQPTRFDPTRAPEGRHVAWAYCHVPHGWTGDAEDIITSQIERFAPGFRDTILGTATISPADFERRNPNNVGGDITGGAATLGQLLARPRWSPHPHATAIDDVYLCSSSTAPGAGVHGMCGFHAARTAMRRTFRR